MLLILETMGCGRSKQQSPKLGNRQDPSNVNGTREKGSGKKKKQKGEKKENKEPQKNTEKPAEDRLSPTLPGSNMLKIPSTINGSSQQTLNIDIEYPTCRDQGDKGMQNKSKDIKEYSGKQTNIKVTNSQLEFFKMLDEKIEQGCDYKSEDGISISTP